MLFYIRKNESRLEAAARLILNEHDDLVDSAPRGLLNQLEEIALELQRIEDRL
jgi:hypothetical protein